MVTSELSTTVDADMSSVRVARQFVQTVLPDDVPVEVTSDVLLATSELVTNAVEYGSGAAIQVTVRVTECDASITVTSAGSGPVPLAAVDRWEVAGVDERSGRGLGIVRAVADDVVVDRSNDSVAITFTLRLTAR